MIFVKYKIYSFLVALEEPVDAKVVKVIPFPPPFLLRFRQLQGPADQHVSGLFPELLLRQQVLGIDGHFEHFSRELILPVYLYKNTAAVRIVELVCQTRDRLNRNILFLHDLLLF